MYIYLRDLNVPMNENNLELVAHSSDAIRNAFLKIFGKDHSMPYQKVMFNKS